MVRTNHLCWRWLLSAFLTLITLSTVWASEEDLIAGRAWLKDASGKMTWEMARQAPMAPFQGAISAGYGPEPIWLRIRIDPSRAEVPPDSSIYMRIRPGYLNEITLFDPLQSPPERPPLGDTHPITNQFEPAANFVYILPVGNGPRDVWLRIKTDSARLVYVEVMPQSSYRLSEAKIKHWGSLSFGVLGVFLMWGLIQAVVRPERLIIGFVVYQTIALLLGFYFSGYAYLYFSDYLPLGSIDFFTSLLIILSTGAALVFSYFLLEELGPLAWRRRLFLALFLIYPVLLVMLLTGHTRFALQINMLSILIVPWVVLLTALASPKAELAPDQPGKAQTPKTAVLIYFAASLLAIMLTALPALGVMQGSVLSIYSVFFYGFSSGLTMTLLLQYRSYRIQKQEIFLRASVKEADARAEQEKSFREDRERLLAMLGHELKTPLATIRMKLARNDVSEELSQLLQEQVTDMNNVLERALDLGLIEAGEIKPIEEPVDVIDLITRLCRELPNGGRIEYSVTESDSMVVTTDPALLKTILRNLLDNALKYSPPNSTVRLQIVHPNSSGQWEVWVSNLIGRAGVPNDQRIFQKYYRSPKASHRSGSGLGLYLIHGLARLLKGELRYAPQNEEVRFQLIMQSTR